MNILHSEPVKLWSRNFVFIILANLTVLTAVNMLLGTLPLYVKEIGGSNLFSGLVVGVYAFTSLLSRPFIGSLIDAKGRKSMFYIGILIIFFSAISFHMAFTVSILLIIRTLQGIGFSAVSTSAGTIVADIVPSARLSEGISYYGISLTLPTAIGPSFGLFLMEHYSYTVLFNIVAIITFIAFLFALPIQYQMRRETKIEKRSSLFEKSALLPSLVMFFIALGLSSILTFIPQYAATKNIEGAGMYFIFYAGSLLVCRLFSGKLADRIGPTPVVIPGVILIAFSFIILSNSLSLFGLLFSACMFGIGFGSVQPIMNAIVIRRVSPERKGAASAIFIASMDLGMAIGSIGWGLLSETIGFTHVYLLSSICAIISCYVYFIMIKKSNFVRKTK